MKFGIVGNCRYNALIDERAALLWLCWPQFDSSSVFGKLLDPAAGSFEILPKNEEEWRTEQVYIRNTNILKTLFISKNAEFEVVDFAPRYRKDDVIMSRNVFHRIVRPLRGNPSFRLVVQPRYDYGRESPKVKLLKKGLQFRWKSGKSSLLKISAFADALLADEFIQLNGEPLYLSFWWDESESSALPQPSDVESSLERTANYWTTWVKHLRLPIHFQAQVIRSALVLKLHQFEESGAITAATTTSLPESPGSGRNWDYRFCWLRDAYFSISALFKIGHFEEMEKFALYLSALSGRDLERLQPVYAVDGRADLTESIREDLAGYLGEKPVRIGNAAYTHIQNDIYGEMILAISPLFLDERLNNDGLFVRERLAPVLRRLIGNIEERLEEPDAGLWELRNTQALHGFTVLMHWLGARRAHLIAKKLEDSELLLRTERLMDAARDLMETRLWNESIGAYVQSEGSKALDAAMLGLINMGYLDPKSEIARRHMAAIEERLLTLDGLVFRYTNPDDFGFPESTFTVCSFWYVEALARMGRGGESRKAMEKLLALANPLGLYSEDIDPRSFQLWGNFPQTYSHVGLIHAAFAMDDPLGDPYEAPEEHV